MKVLITGGAGFIGSNLADALVSRGDEVYVLDDLSQGTIANLKHNLSKPNFHFVNGSILDLGALEKVVKECEIIFHLAAVVGVKYIVADPLRSITVNVRGTENVLEVAFRHQRKVIFASSSEVYGKGNNIPFKEDDDRILGPTNINRWSYSLSKAIDEHLCFAYCEKGLPVVILRYFNCYGPRINELGYGTVVANFIRQALSEEPITVHGDGTQTRSFTYIDDIVNGTILSAEVKEAEGEVLNIGNYKETSILQLANLIKNLTGSKSQIIHVPHFDYYGQSYEDTPRRVPNVEKARRILGFEPKVSLEEGLKQTIQWWRTNYKHSSRSQ